ncbi:NAD(+) diphosphatase [Microbacterium halophytorum]|uniref:NAD(+) diphosphatase n=1 Tax=Microbacterium halophytorum TaxID=2067568 RepID=UPI000CFD92C0|nr:NAD(+) diphosphatase [Microbacterium halophytorum]
MFQPAPSGRIDRAAGERERRDVIERAFADPATRVLLVHGDAAPRSGDGLGWFAPSDIRERAEAPIDWAFLGRDAEGSAVLAAVAAGPDAPIPGLDEGWLTLRRSGELSPEAFGAFTAAVSIGRFAAERFCPRCGSEAPLTTAGWARTCSGCGRELFPRTDPAVIVVPESVDGERILLGANAAWNGEMYSCFAGFVEAGESLEDAVHRELFEEAGVRLSEVRYIASQPWPYPRSLMLGYRAVAETEDGVRADGTEIIDVRWFSRDEIRAGLRGETDFGLPGRVSIAHRLIRGWAEHEAAGAEASVA